MSEREKPQSGGEKPEFGKPITSQKRTRKRSKKDIPEDRSLSGPDPSQVVAQELHQPALETYTQHLLPGMLEVDWEAVLEADRQVRSREYDGSTPIEDQDGVIWEAPQAQSPAERLARADELRALFERHHIDIDALRSLVATGGELNRALKSGEVSVEIRHLLEVFAAVLRPLPNERIRSPADAAALLMTEMLQLDQEQLRVLCLDTKNRLQKIHLVYQGSLNSAQIRIGEVYKEPLRLNSAAIIVAHNHPSGEPDPSPEDILVTRQIVEAGKLLDVECLDHLVVGHGRWVSMRQRGLGFG
jgi:DNA repair protein RadC